MLGKLLAGTAVLAIAGSTLVLAQTSQGPAPAYNQQPPGQQPMQYGPGQNDQYSQQPGHQDGDDDDDDDDDDHAQNQTGQQQQQYGYQPQQGPGQQYGYQSQQGPGQQYGYQPQRAPRQQYGYEPQQGPGQQYGYHPQQGPGQQYGPGPGMGPQQYGQQPQQDAPYNLAGLPSAEDINAFVEGRLASLRAGLKLNNDQSKNWTPFEQASRELAKLELERAAQMREQRPQQTAAVAPQAPAAAKPGAPAAQQAAAPPPPPNVFEDMSRSADALMKDGAAFKRLADAGSALYKSLDDDQKNRFMELSQGLLPH